MINRQIKAIGLTAVVGALLNSCAWLGKGDVFATQDAADPAPINIVDGGLLVSRSGEPELGLTLVNNAARTLWVNVHFKTPGGLSDCVATKELEPRASRLYVCPQSSVRANTDYPVHISVFSDLEQTQSERAFSTHFQFNQADIEILRSAKPR